MKNFLFPSVLILTLSVTSFAKTVIVATTGETSPANSSSVEECTKLNAPVVKTEDGRSLCGFEVELVQEVCAAQGLECKWVIQPFGPAADPKALPAILAELVQSKPRYDLAINFMRGTVDRMLALNTSATYYEGHPSIYTSARVKALAEKGAIRNNENRFPLPQDASIEKLRIAAAGSYEQEIKTHYTEDELKKIEIVQVAAFDEQVKKLNSGEVDFVFGPDQQAIAFKNAGLLTYEAMPISTLSNSIEKGSRIYAAPTVEGIDLIGKVNAGLAQIKISGKFDEVYKRYNMSHTWGCVNGPRLSSTAAECAAKAAQKSALLAK